MDSLAALQIMSCAPHETSRLVKLYFSLLKKELNLDAISWMAAYRGRYGQKKSDERKLLNEWLAFDMIYDGEDLDPFREKTNYVVSAIAQGGVDPLTEAVITSTGSSRTHMFFDYHSRQDLDHWSIKLHESFNAQDRILGIFSFGDYCESIILADRASRQNCFTKDEERKLFDLTVAFPRVHYWLMLERGLLCHRTNPLSLSERRVLQYIIKGYPDKSIARELNLEVSSVRSIVSSIYKKFEVSNRVNLILLWYKNLDQYFPSSSGRESAEERIVKDFNGDLDKLLV